MFEQQPHLFRCSLLYRVDVQFPDGLPQSVNLVAVLHVDRLRQCASVIGRASFACHGATVTTVPLEGVAQGKHIDGGKMCDGWPAGPAPVLLSHCLTASAIHRLSSMASLTFRKVWAYFFGMPAERKTPGCFSSARKGRRGVRARHLFSAASTLLWLQSGLGPPR